MRCATSSPIPTPAPCCPCSEQPPVRERGSPFFLFFREKKEGRFLFFLFFQKKKRKNQRKETLSGRGMNGNHRAALPRKETLTGRDLRENFRAALPAALCVSGEGSVLSFPSGKERKNQRKKPYRGGICAQTIGQPSPQRSVPVFSCGAFLKEKPRKYFCGECAFRRRAGAAGQPKRVPELSFWFFFFHRKKKNEKTLRKEKITNLPLRVEGVREKTRGFWAG